MAATTQSEGSQTREQLWKLYEMGSNVVAIVVDKGSQLYKEASEPGHVQQKTQAFTRTAVGVISIKYFTGSSILGALTASLFPKPVKYITDYVDGGITGIWDKMTFQQKIAAASTGVALVTFGLSQGYLDLPGSMFAFQLGARICNKNYENEQLAHAAKVAKEQLLKQQ